MGFSPFLNEVFFESVKKIWSSFLRSCSLIHDWRPSMTLGWMGTIFDSFVFVEDFSIVRVPSLKLRFLTLMVVISLTRPAEKYISSASSEYLIGRFEQKISIWCSVKQADFPDRFVLHIVDGLEGMGSGDRVLRDDQPWSTTMILGLLDKTPSIKTGYYWILVSGVEYSILPPPDQSKISTNITIPFDERPSVVYMGRPSGVLWSTPPCLMDFRQNRSNPQPTTHRETSRECRETGRKFNRLNPL